VSPDLIEAQVDLPGGVKVPIAKWTVTWFSVIAVTGIAFGVYRYFYPIEPELVSVKQANHLLRLEVQEYNTHILETPVVTLEVPDKVIRVTAYEDGCVILARKFNGKTTTRLLVDPNRADLQHKPGDNSKLPSFGVTLNAMGRCLNPHPGRFIWNYGARVDQCWVQVVRTFEDGCQHVQLFNACSNSWATTMTPSRISELSTPRGSAKIC